MPAGAWQWHGRPIRFSRDRRLLTRHPSMQHTFFGGDLEGVRQSLDYLQSLGVTVLYLNPIFAASSTHRYDAVDYLRIDPILGGREDFERLSADLRARGMRLFLDGVFNHTSTDHPWHRDPAMRRRFYVMEDGTGRAMSWMGRGTLPKLDLQKECVVRSILRVVDGWPQADGWRLDAAHLYPHAVLRRLREHAAGRPMIVEDWQHAGHYFRDGLADGVTNFLFREAVCAFFREDASPETLLERLRVWIEGYPPRCLPYCWNFLDNHDTGRFVTMAGGARLRRALVLLFTLPGAPLLYHGVEVGLEGRHAGESRAPMPWNEAQWDGDLLAHVRRLSELRRTHAALWRGTWRPLFADNRSRTLAFERADDETGERLLVALNDGYQPVRVRLPGGRTFRMKPGAWRILGGKGFRSVILADDDAR
ncbi:MAG: cyclomaltodextrinase [Candidatus Sumerlaeia bacterium]